MADDVPEVAEEYGPPNPFEASPDQPGSYGPPSDVFSGGGSSTGSSTGSGSSGGTIDLSGLVKAAGDAVGSVVKTVTGLATPPAPKIPTPPSAPNLPATLPPAPLAPTPQAPTNTPGGIVPSAGPQVPGSAGGGTVAATPGAPRLSTGAKVAIGLGVGGILVGGGLLIASAAGERKTR